MRCFDCDRHRRGFTLVEAVVGTVLIGVFASAALLAFKKHSDQLQNAADTLQAVEFADAKLDQLMQGKTAVRPASGTVSGRPGWKWSVAPITQFPIMNAAGMTSRFTVVRSSDKRVLVSIDFVSHVKPPKRSGGATL